MPLSLLILSINFINVPPRLKFTSHIVQVSAPRKKLLYERSHTDAFFAEKVVLCYRCKTRHMVGENVLIATPTPENFTMSLIEQGDTPRENQISVQPESALIRPDGGPWQKTPTLMEEPDKGRLPLRKSFQSFRKYLRQTLIFM